MNIKDLKVGALVRWATWQENEMIAKVTKVSDKDFCFIIERFTPAPRLKGLTETHELCEVSQLTLIKPSYQRERMKKLMQYINS